MECNYQNKNVTHQDCSKCDNDECPIFDSGVDDSVPFVTEKSTVKPEQSEVKKLLNDKLIQFFGDQVRVDKALLAMMPQLESIILEQSKTLITEAINNYINTVFSGMIDGKLKDIFDSALAEKILSIKDDGTSMRQLVQDMVCAKIKSFLNTKDSYNERDLMKKRVDEVISARVDGMIKPAIDELKAETIEKFTREMMKKMMQGMVKSIAGDKKLLAAMDID